jgi:hypothetical protein
MYSFPAPLLATAALITAGCSTGTLGVAAQSPQPTAADARADALVQVAKNIYQQEVSGSVGRSQVRRILRDRVLDRAWVDGNRKALRAEALRQLFLKGKHVVRLRVMQSGHVLTDVGGRFVVGDEIGVLRTANGQTAGRLEISMQDVLGYRKLVNRLTGAEIVIRGRPGHVETSLPAAASVSLPGSGTVSLDGQSYIVREFHERGFGQESLSVWLLVPST